jgi:hypothetical protein
MVGGRPLAAALLRPQTTHRINERGADGLETGRQQCNYERAEARTRKNPPGQLSAVIVILQPAAHKNELWAVF